MAGYIILILCLFLGAALVRRLPLSLHVPEYLAASAVVGLFIGTWILFLPSILIPYRFAFPLAGVVMALLAVWLWQGGSFTKWTALPARAWVWIPIGAGLSAFLAYILYTHLLMPTADGWNTVGNTWGDLALHLSLISRLAVTDKVDFRLPILIGQNLTYPFLIDFLSAVLYRSGMGLRLALLLPSGLLALSFVQLFFFLSYRLFKKVRGAVIGVLLFLFASSFAGLSEFYADWRASDSGLITFVQAITKTYDHLPNQGLHLTNVILGYLIPQRGYLFGLPVFCLLAILWFEADREKDAKTRNWLLWAAALLLGLLPFAHVHTFFVAALIFGYLTLQSMLREKCFITSWTLPFGAALILVFPQLAWQFLASYHSGFSFYQLGWLKSPDQGLVTFWWRNMGPGLVFLIATPFLAGRYLNRRFDFGFFLPFLIIFVAANLFSFQPNGYDNGKLFLYVWLAVCLYAGYFLARWSEWFRGAWILVAILMLAMMGSGILGFIPDITKTYAFLSNDDQTFATDFQKVVPVDALVLTADRHNHPVPTLTGRRIVMGYRGWLWTYGYDYVPIERDVRTMFAGSAEGDALLQSYGIDYVVIGNTERMEWGANQVYFEQHFQEVYSGGEWEVFKVD
ncbi:MAG: hypothetical protein WCO52_00970 [bacterium]